MTCRLPQLWVKPTSCWISRKGAASGVGAPFPRRCREKGGYVRPRREPSAKAMNFTGCDRGQVASLAAVDSPRLRFPVVVLSLCSAHLLGSHFLVSLVSHPPEALPVELVEADAVCFVGDQDAEHGPDERQAALLAGEAADHLGGGV
jgi:hypothetical protein